MLFFNNKNIFQENVFAKDFLQVYSHPRSGTHFLEAFIGENFYPQEDLSIKNVVWGHWKNRQTTNNINKYGKLFGSHIFPNKELMKIENPSIYIYRDPRAVAYSIWNTPNFINPNLKAISFSDFLRIKLDWHGSPAYKTRPKFTIAEHWKKHLIGWEKAAQKNPNIMLVTYEVLLESPYKVYLEINNKFKFHKPPLNETELVIIDKPIGILPNKGIKNSWEESFTKEDLTFFHKKLKGLILD